MNEACKENTYLIINVVKTINSGLNKQSDRCLCEEILCKLKIELREI